MLVLELKKVGLVHTRSGMNCHCVNIYICKLSSVKKLMWFILHAPYDLSVKTCIIAHRRSTFSKKKNKSITFSIWAN